eukprot:1068640-Pyramimonas_sp.AAC.1
MAKAGTAENIYAQKWNDLEKQKKERIDEVDAWYNKQKAELQRLHSTAMEQERKKAQLVAQQAARKQQEMAMQMQEQYKPLSEIREPRAGESMRQVAGDSSDADAAWSTKPLRNPNGCRMNYKDINPSV